MTYKYDYTLPDELLRQIAEQRFDFYLNRINLSSTRPSKLSQRTVLHQGFAERFVRERFSGKLRQRLLRNEKRAIKAKRRVIGSLMLIVGIWAGANVILLATGGG